MGWPGVGKEAISLQKPFINSLINSLRVLQGAQEKGKGCRKI